MAHSTSSSRSADWLRTLAAPDSIAVIGASRGRATIGNRILDSIANHRYTGELFAVHPDAIGEESGARWVKSFDDLPTPPEVAIVAVPAARVHEVLEDADAAGVKVAVVISSGFAEASEEGAKLEAALRTAAKQRWKMRVIGPNCVGYISREKSLVATFTLLLPPSDPRISSAMTLPPSRSIVISQSGALMAMIARQLWYRGSPPDLLLHFGNGSDLDVTDALAALDPPSPTRIGLYLEGLEASSAPRFVAAVRKLSAGGNLVALLKVGRTSHGTQAIQSHTGRLGGDYAAYQAALRTCGAIAVDDLQELCNIVGWQGRSGLSRAAILSASGGMGVWFADRLARAGFQLPQPSDGLKEALRRRLPAFAAAQNPLDTTGMAAVDPTLLRDILALFKDSGEYDVLFTFSALVKTEKSMNSIEAVVPQNFDREKDPAILITWAAPVNAEDLRAPAGMAMFEDQERAVQLAENMRRRRAPLSTDLAPFQLEGPVDFDAALAACGVRRPRRFTSTLRPLTKHELDSAATLFPAVVKAESPEVLHKEVAGLVRVWVCDERTLKSCQDEFRTALVRHGADIERARFVVEEFVPVNWELLVDLRRDEVFGWIFTVGIGGRQVEDVHRTARALAPVGVQAARDLLEEVFPASLYRVESIAAVLSRLSQLGAWLEGRRILELELNPLGIHSGGGAVALDVVHTSMQDEVHSPV